MIIPNTFLMSEVALLCIPTSLIKRSGINRIKTIPTIVVRVSDHILMRIFAQINHHTIEIVANGIANFRMIFFFLKNSISAPILMPTAPTLLVAIAICGGNQKNISIGMDSSHPLPAIAPIHQVTSPRINIKKIIQSIIIS